MCPSFGYPNNQYVYYNFAFNFNSFPYLRKQMCLTPPHERTLGFAQRGTQRRRLNRLARAVDMLSRRSCLKEEVQKFLLNSMLTHPRSFCAVMVI